MNLKDAKPGVKVACVDGEFSVRSHDPFRDLSEVTVPQEGQNYTIREVVQTMDGWGLRLEEITNPEFWHVEYGYQEPCFALSRFECA